MEQWKQELQTVTKKIESCLKNDEDRTKKTTLEKRLALNLTLSSFKAGRAHRHILNDRKTVDPADCFYDPSIYNMSFQGATTLLATKVSSETQHFGTTQSLKHHVHPAYGFSFSNSRLSNYADIQNEELENTLKNNDVYPHILVIDKFSPIAWAIVRYYHESPTGNKIPQILHRPSIKSKHAGRDKSIIMAERTKDILNINIIAAIIAAQCRICKLRLNKYKISSEGRLHEEQWIKDRGTFLAAYIDLLGPIKIKQTAGPETRSSTTHSYYVLVAVCSTTRALRLSLISGTDKRSVANGLHAITARAAVPVLWYADRQSSFVSIAKQGQWGILTDTQTDTSIRLEDFVIYFAPVTGQGHQAHAIVERMIQKIKDSFGSTNLKNSGLDCCQVYNLLIIIERQLNMIPMYLRRVNCRDAGKFSNILTRLISPSMLLGEPTNRSAASFIRIEHDMEYYYKDVLSYKEILNDFYSAYLTTFQKNAKTDYKPTTNISLGAVVAFKIKEEKFSHSTTPWRFGMVVSEKTPTLDDNTRTVDVQYLSHPEDSTNKDGKLVNTTRRVDQLIIIVDPTDTTLSDEFGMLANHTEEIINKMARNNFTTYDSETDSDDDSVETNHDAQMSILSGCEVEFQIRELNKTKDKLLIDKQRFQDNIDKNTTQIRDIESVYHDRETEFNTITQSSKKTQTDLNNSLNKKDKHNRDLLKHTRSLEVLRLDAIDDSIKDLTQRCKLIKEEVKKDERDIKVIDELLENNNRNIQDKQNELIDHKKKHGPTISLRRDLFSTNKTTDTTMDPYISSDTPATPSQIRFDLEYAPPSDPPTPKMLSSDSPPTPSPIRFDLEYATPSDLPTPKMMEVQDEFWTDIPGEPLLSPTESKPSTIDSHSQHKPDNEPLNISEQNNEESGRGKRRKKTKQCHCCPPTTSLLTMLTLLTIITPTSGTLFSQGPQDTINGNADTLTHLPDHMLFQTGSTIMNCDDEPHTDDLIQAIWMRQDGKPVKDNKVNYEGHQLKIEDANQKDAGVYLCITKSATNGIHTYTRRVQIIPKPTDLLAKHFKKTEDTNYVMTAYHCLDSQSKMTTVNLRSVGRCNRGSFTNYENPRNKYVTILYRRPSITLNAVRCKLKITILSGYCGQGFGGYRMYSNTNGFTLDSAANFPLSVDQCHSAYEKKTSRSA